MMKIIALAVAMLSQPAQTADYAPLCMKTGEQVQGAVRFCFYTCAGLREKTITVPASSYCPMNVR